MSHATTPQAPVLRATRLRLHAQHQAVAVMRTDCHVCRAEGLAPRSQVLVSANGREVYALLYQTDDPRAPLDQVALSEAAWEALGIEEGAPVRVRHVLRGVSSSAERVATYPSSRSE